MDKVTVVIITYKRSLNILERAIDSVRKQTYSNWELLVVNDAPEEVILARKIKKMTENFNDQRIKYISYESNMGANYARNVGLANSIGKYIAFLDDDDEWLTNKLEMQVKEFTEDKIALVYCGFSIITNKGNIKDRMPTHFDKDIMSKLLESNFIGSTSFPLLLKEAVVSVGGFDVSLKSCQEYDLWIRLCQDYKFVCVNQVLGRYYLSNDSTFRKNMSSFHYGDKYILNKYKLLFLKYKKSYNMHLNEMSYSFFMGKNFRLSLKYKTKAILIMPFCLANFTVIFKLFKNIGQFMANYKVRRKVAR